MNTLIESASEPVAAADGLKASRFQIYRQTRVAEFQSESEATEAFLSAAPHFRGRRTSHLGSEGSKSLPVGGLGGRENRLRFAVRHRMNLFRDPLLGIIARQVQEHETLRKEIQMRERVSVQVYQRHVSVDFQR